MGTTKSCRTTAKQLLDLWNEIQSFYTAEEKHLPYGAACNLEALMICEYGKRIKLWQRYYRVAIEVFPRIEMERWVAAPALYYKDNLLGEVTAVYETDESLVLDTDTITFSFKWRDE